MTMTAMKYLLHTSTQQSGYLFVCQTNNGQAMTTVGVAQQPLQGFKYQVLCSLLWIVGIMSSSQHDVVDGEPAQAGSTASARGRLEQPQQQQPQEQQPQDQDLARDAETSPSTRIVARRQRQRQRELHEELLLQWQQEQQQYIETMVVELTGAGVTYGVADFRLMRAFENARSWSAASAAAAPY